MSSPLFVDSGWKFSTSEGADISAGLNLISVTASSGSLFLDDSSGSQYQFDYISAGASLGIGLAISLDFATKDMFSTGIVYANSLESETPDADDLTGACLIYQGTGISLFGAGATGSVIFLDVGLGIVASWAAFAASGGMAGGLAPAIVIASCSAVVAYSGLVLGTGGAGVSGALGWVSLFEPED